MIEPGPVLVLGGTGFIGRHIVDALRNAGQAVLAPGRPDLDLTTVSPPELAGLLSAHRVRAVVNATGAVWSGGPDRMRQLNTDVPRKLAAALGGAGGSAHLVQLGSSVEYGPTPAGVAIREDTPARPAGSYARSKLAATTALRTMLGPRLTVLRVFNAIGPGQPVSSLLGGVAARLAAAAPGTPVGLEISPLWDARDFVDVRDVAEAVRCAVDRRPAGRIVNIGSGRARPVGEVLAEFIASTGREVLVTTAAGDESIRSGGLAWQRADVTAAERLLGWRPGRPLSGTLHDLWTAALAAHSRTSQLTSGVDGGF
jgi:NDP-hexose 4-ketoreductase